MIYSAIFIHKEKSVLRSLQQSYLILIWAVLLALNAGTGWAIESVEADQYLIGPDDVLQIDVWRAPDLSKTVTVRPDGMITLPLIGDLQAADRTPGQLREEIRQRLEKFKQSPTVTVTVSEVNSYVFYVLGEVVNPGRYQVKSFTTVVQAVALAGGFTQWADKDNIVILRKDPSGVDQQIKIGYSDFMGLLGDTSPQIVLRRGDTVIVGSPSITGMFSKIGRYLFIPSLRLNGSFTALERYDDNVLFERGGVSPDAVTVLIPQLRISSTHKQYPGRLQYRALFEQYSEHTSLDTTKQLADLEWAINFPADSSLTLVDHFYSTPDSTEIRSLGIATPREDAYGNDVNAIFHSPLLDLSYDQNLYEFDDLALRDTLSHRFEERFGLPILARQRLTEGYRFRQYIEGGEFALRTHSVGLGLRHYFLPTFFVGAEGGIAFGRFPGDDSFRREPMIRVEMEGRFALKKPASQLKFSLGYLEDIEADWFANLEYNWKDALIKLGYARELTVGSGFLPSLIHRNRIDLHLKQTLWQRLQMDIGAQIGYYEMLGSSTPQFVVYRGEVGIGYAFLPWLNAQVGYALFVQDTSAPGGLYIYEFARNQATFSLMGMLP